MDEKLNVVWCNSVGNIRLRYEGKTIEQAAKAYAWDTVQESCEVHCRLEGGGEWDLRVELVGEQTVSNLRGPGSND